MAEEFVTVAAGGRVWSGFRRVMVRRSFRHAAGEFHLDIAAEDDPFVSAAAFAAGTPVDILANGDLLLSAFVDRYRPKIAGHNSAEIAVSGRSKSQDFIDSSALHETGYFKNKTVLEIARELDRFGTGFSSDVPLEKIPEHQLTPGDTAFVAVEKLARSHDLWLSGQADGSIKLTLAGSGRNAPVIEGVNMLSGDADHNWAGRHSRVIVRGQRPYGHGRDALEIEAEARDAEVGRNRPLVIIDNEDTDKARATRRAKKHRDAEAGNSLRANVRVQGFHDATGALWQPGNLVFLDSPFLAVSRDMAIDSVTFAQDRRSGSETTLALVDPRALGGKSRAGGKADKKWNTGAGG